MKEFSWEHRLFRDSAKGKQKQDGLLGSNFQGTYQEYYIIYRDWLYNLLLNVIKYENIPETFNPQGLEYMLRTYGYAVIAASDADNIFVSGFTGDNVGTNTFGNIIGQFDDTNIMALLGDKPTQLTRVNVGKVSGPVYIGLANKFSYFVGGSSTADLDLIDRAAQTMAEIKANEILNMRQMKTPFFGFTKNKNLTNLNVWRKIAAGEPFIQIDSEIDDISDVISTIPLNVPSYLAQFKDQWDNELNELLSQLGINNLTSDKKERLVVDEVNANNQLISISLQIYLDARNNQLALLNKQLGTEIKAVPNDEIVTQIKQAAQQLTEPDDFDQQTEEGGEEENG